METYALIAFMILSVDACLCLQTEVRFRFWPGLIWAAFWPITMIMTIIFAMKMNTSK